MDDTTPAFSKRITYKLIQIIKKGYQKLFCASPHQPKKILFILGCQRSGTSIMTRIFERDLQVKVYGEYSGLSSQDENGLRLNPLDSVKKIIDTETAPLLVIKPIVESQRAKELLEYFNGSKAIWMYRHYKDVAASNLKKFSAENCINNLRPIVEGDSTNWRAENITEKTKKIVSYYFNDQMNPADAAALFWYARNSCYFDMDLNSDERVVKIDYDELINNPHDQMKKIYNFLEKEFPGPRILAEVHAKSKGKGKDINISREVEELCNGLWDALKR